MFLHIKEEKVTCQRKGERYSLGRTYGIHFVTLTRPYGVETGALILGLKHICFQKKKKMQFGNIEVFHKFTGSDTWTYINVWTLPAEFGQQSIPAILPHRSNYSNL